MTRSKKALCNTICSIIAEVVAAVCSFILPRLILSRFGSAYNGITSSISQFISCIALLKSGIGSVTRAALYKPLAQNDNTSISGIFVATERFMRKIAGFFLGALIVFAAIYPFAVQDEFSWTFSFTLVLIIGTSTFAQYYFGIANQMLLEADQRQYISIIISICGTILNTVIAALLILLGCPIHVVQLGSALIFTIQPILLRAYVSKKYHIDRTVAPDNIALSQRWDAFGHQLASFVNTNTDIIVLTVATNVFEVSVYTVYCMVAHAVRKGITAFTGGVGAAFGNMLAKNEREKLFKYFKAFDFLVFIVSLWAFACTAVLITSFVGVYTKNITDVNYYRPIFGLLLAFSEFLVCIKIPYQILVQTYGCFKQTRTGSFIEAGMNIALSVILVNFIGLEGILIGTIAAALYRVIDYAVFSQKNLIPYPKFYHVKKLVSLVIVSVTAYGLLALFQNTISNYWEWILLAIEVSLCILLIVVLIAVFLFIPETKDILLFYKAKRGKKHD